MRTRQEDNGQRAVTKEDRGGWVHGLVNFVRRNTRLQSPPEPALKALPRGVFVKHERTVFSCGRRQHYYQPSDTPERLNHEKMARVAALLGNLALACAQVDLPKARAEADTAAFEIALLKRALGPMLPVVLVLCRVRQLEGRADLDALVSVLTGLRL